MKRKTVILFFFVALCKLSNAQTGCPANIGFESGNFQKWSLDTGSVKIDGTYNLDPCSMPQLGRHTLIKNSFPVPYEPLGGFPKNAPNGGEYTVQLGSSGFHKNADRMSYTVDVPAGVTEYNIIINYALIIETGGEHYGFQLGAFDFAIIDDATDKRIDCPSFDYLAAPGHSTLSEIPNTGVFYRRWTAIPLKLGKYAGKKLRLQFTTRRCVDGYHGAYAYLDIAEGCKSFITGNVVCNNEGSITLASPTGFLKYRWFNSDFTQVLGNANTVVITPTPPNGTIIPLEVTYNTNTNCRDTFYTTIKYIPGGFSLVVPPELKVCPQPFDLTAPSVTAGSSPNLILSYYLDSLQTIPVPSPKAIEKEGTYFIKAVNELGCTMIKGVKISYLKPPKLITNKQPPVCFPATVDITKPDVTKGSDPNLTFSYWMNIDTTKPLLQPNAVSQSGMYYIKAMDQNKCSSVEPIEVIAIDLVFKPLSGCGEVQLYPLPNSPIMTFSIWADTNATIPTVLPDKVNKSVTYYIKGTTNFGCSLIGPWAIEVYPTAAISVSNPPQVFYPATVDITAYVSGNNGQQYGYWTNAQLDKPLVNPKKVDSSGTYYISAVNTYGCSTSAKINVLIVPPPPVKITVANAFTPNNDGINDRLVFNVEGMVVVKQLRVYDRWSRLIFQTNDINNHWRGIMNNNKPAGTGTYYWVLEVQDFFRKANHILAGSVTVIR
jgi:gliding motility-associated-like protein